MSIQTQNPEIDRLAHILADMRVVSIDDAILGALQETVGDNRIGFAGNEYTSQAEKELALKRIKAIVHRLSLEHIQDNRSGDEIIGYNEHGAFN